MISIHNVTGISAKLGSLEPRSWIELVFNHPNGETSKLAIFVNSERYHEPLSVREIDENRFVVDLCDSINSIAPMPAPVPETAEA